MVFGGKEQDIVVATWDGKGLQERKRQTRNNTNANVFSVLQGKRGENENVSHYFIFSVVSRCFLYENIYIQGGHAADG
jgi:hypothetical protein